MTGSAYHTHAMLILIHKIMGPSLQVNFYESTEKDLEIGIFLRAADIKSLYTNISRDLWLKALEYWIERLQEIYIYIYINKTFIHHVKGTATGTHAPVVYANVTLFNKLPETFDIVWNSDIVELFWRLMLGF